MTISQRTSDLICSGVPPEVALVMAQAASFLVLNSAFCRISIRTGKILASITVCEVENRKTLGEIDAKFVILTEDEFHWRRLLLLSQQQRRTAVDRVEQQETA